MRSKKEVAARNCRISLFEDGKADQDCKSLDETLAEAIALVKGKEIDGIVVDFSGHDAVPNSDLRALTMACLALRKLGSKPAAAKTSKALRDLLSEQGLEDLFLYPDDKPKARGKPLLDAEFISPFIEGAIETLRVQCSTKAMPTKPVLKRTFKPAYQIDIMGIIGVTNKSFNGSIAICFPERTFLAAMSKMFGEPVETVTPDLRDGVGELLNILFGMAKVKLNKADHRVEKALPSVIHGKEIGLRHMTSEVSIVIPFTTDAGPFHMEIGLEPHTA